MNHLILRRAGLAVAMAAALAACTNMGKKASTTTGSHGINLASMDTTVKPGQDFYKYANGNWLKNNPVPASEGDWGSFDVLNEQSRNDVRAILEEDAKAAASATKGSPTQLVGDFYASALDSTLADKLGYDPIKPDLAELAALKDVKDLPAYLGKQAGLGNSSLIGTYVNQDSKNSTQYLLSMYQTGLGLPDRDYYFKTDSSSMEAREKYVEYLTKLGTLTGNDAGKAKADAELVMKLEMELAKSHRTNVETRDPIANYNKTTFANLAKTYPNLNFPAFFAAMPLAAPASVDVSQPGYYEALNSMMASHSIDEWKTYLRLHMLNDASDYLSSPFVQANFDMYSKTLSGIKEQKPRWKRAAGVLNATVGELIGQEYVKKHFTPEAKAKAVELIDNLKAALAERIKGLPWMAEATKKEALKKLSTIAVKVGYPDKWKAYEGLVIKRDDLMGNLKSASGVAVRRELAKLGKPLDRTEWGMNPQTVNAYYNPSMNEIVFPAAILHPPFFDADADDASNYGGIGAVIGHELTHGFDDEGRQFDEQGNLRDWWTKEDAAKYKVQTASLAAQFNNTEALPGLKVNGNLTLGENIADLGGIKIAYEALQMALKKNPSKNKTIDGMTQDQRYFIAWAQVWAMNSTDKAMRQLIATNPHSPGTLRGYMPLTNLPEFYKAFNLKAGDKMMRPEAERTSVW